MPRFYLEPRFGKGLIAASVCLLLSGCFTAMYGEQFVPDKQVANRYSIEVYQSLFAGEGTSTDRANHEAEEFRQAHGYKSCKVVHREYHWTTDSHTYDVQCQ